MSSTSGLPADTTSELVAIPTQPCVRGLVVFSAMRVPQFMPLDSSGAPLYRQATG